MNRTHGLSIQADNLGGQVPFFELRMLVEFYAPSLSEKVDAIESEWGELSRFFADAIMTDDKSDYKSREIILGGIQRTANITSVIKSAQAELNQLASQYREKQLQQGRGANCAPVKQAVSRRINNAKRDNPIH
jgi:hypothetical protein